MCNLSRQFPQTSAHFGHDKIRNKRTGRKNRAQLVENPEALGFHQKIQERKINTEI